MPVDPSIFNNVKTYQDYEAQEMQKQLLAAQAKKALIPDIDDLGKQAYLKAANGIPLSNTEAAALSYIDQKSQTYGFNPATGALEQKPSLLQRIGMPSPGNVSNMPTPKPSAPMATDKAAAMDYLFGDGQEGLQSAPIMPSGLNSGLTPKAKQKFLEADIESGRKRVDELTATASNASAAGQAAQLMQDLQPSLGYTGTGATITAATDKALSAIGMPNFISGDPSAREAFQSQGVKAWVEATQPMKGALSDREGAKLDLAVPNLSTTPEGIKKITEITKIMGERAREKSQFYESYFAQNGSLTGADQIWNDYAAKNPVITDEILGLGKKPVTKESFNNSRGLSADEQEELNQLRARFGK